MCEYLSIYYIHTYIYGYVYMYIYTNSMVKFVFWATCGVRRGVAGLTGLCIGSRV